MLIEIPKTFELERKYIIDVFFNDFLGLDYIIQSNSENINYKICLDNGNSLIIKDNFFSKINNEEYLFIKNIPEKVWFSRNVFIKSTDIPVVYGDRELTITPEHIKCGIDIFSSSFFMLTRWEEYVKKDRDKYNRFPAAESLIYKNNIIDRPIVNEYIEMLWEMLSYLGLGQSRKEHTFSIIPTHDVDDISYMKNTKNLAKRFAKEIIINKDIKAAFKKVPQYIKIKRNKVWDPYDTFDWLMKISEDANIKSHFYFMSGGLTRYDNRYKLSDHKTKQLINNIKQRDHIVGFHPSFDSYNNAFQWKKEKELLENQSKLNIKEGRQHYLRFEAPTTWQIWEDNEMQFDSTLGYADREGFRCGTCYEYPVFNFLTKEKLNLIEYPLISMEVTMAGYRNLSVSEFENKIKILIEIVKKYGGNFVFLWHNSNFYGNNWNYYEKLYEKIINDTLEYG